MLRNYFKVAVRNIFRNRVYSAINIFGLSTAMTLCLLIILFVMDQRSMDTHMADAENTFKILSEFQYKKWGDTRKHATSPYSTLDLLASNHPEMGQTSRLVKMASEIRFEDRIFSFQGLYAEANFFSFFSYPLQEGNEQALSNPNAIVLGEELAAKLFQNEDPIGKQVELGDWGSFLVTGLVNELNTRTHLEFEALISFSSYDQRHDAADLKSDWIAGTQHFHNYFKAEESELNAIQKSLDGFVQLLPPEHQNSYSFSYQALSEASLGEIVANRIGFVTPHFVAWFLAILALIVMFSASFNYVGLTIALGLKRAKEVGVRKIVGAAKKQVFFQFLVEAQVTSLLSLILSLALLGFLVPSFNELKVLRDIDGQIQLNPWDNYQVYSLFFIFAVLIGLVAGGYPAFYVSRMSYGKALGKNQAKGRSPQFKLRKGLILIQYTTSVIFIISAIIMYRQSYHFFHMDYGFDRNNLINVPLKEIPYESFKSELLRDPHVEGVSMTSEMPGLRFMEKREVFVPGVAEPFEISSFAVNEDFLQNFKIRLVQGRNFDSDLQTDEQAVLANSLALDALGFNLDDPEASLQFQRNGINHRVIGVVEEFKYDILWRESGPLVLTYANHGPRFVNIRFRDWDEKTAATAIEDVWRSFDKLRPFEYSYYEFQLSDMYDEFTDIANIISFVAVLAVLIASLGQFGMVLHHVQLKTKEVGIRKTLGANLQQLTVLLSKGFFWIIAIAILAGVPFAWYLNNLWMRKISYSIDFSWWTVALGILLVFTMAVVSILSLTWKTANTNPVESLRYE